MGARCPVKRYRYQVPGLKHPEVTSDFNLQISDFRFQISHCLTTDDRKMGARCPVKRYRDRNIWLPVTSDFSLQISDFRFPIA